MIDNPVETARLLVISHDSAVLSPIGSAAVSNSWRIEIATDAWDAIDRVQSDTRFDLLLLDLPKDHGAGLQIVRALRRIRPMAPIILIGHPGECDRKQESIRMGARDCLIRPFDDGQLEMAIRRNLRGTNEEMETNITSDDVEVVGDGKCFIGASPAMRKLRAQIAQLAESGVPVFLSGESGTGKETIARLLHTLSVRSGFEFAKVDCGTLPEDLLEAEIFGNKAADACASAKPNRGKLELCEKGTIFLDEITEMPLQLQSKLVQVLENGRLVRTGTSEVREVEVCVVAASSISIDQAVSERKLLADLSRKLRPYELQVPALRERRVELPFLSRHFMHRLAKQYGLPARELAPTVSAAWQAYEWPGNLKELEQSVKRYLITGDKELGLKHSAPHAQDASSNRLKKTNGDASTCQPSGGLYGYKSLRALLQGVKEEAEKNAIALALEKTGWNRKAAARLLKTSYRTVLYKIEQYRMSSPGSAPSLSTNGFGPGKAESRGDERAEVQMQDLSRLASGR